MLASSLVALKKKSYPRLIDYISDSTEESSFTLRFASDSMQIDIMCYQNTFRVNDSTFEVTSTWMHPDYSLLSYTRETFGINYQYALLENYIFEPDSNKNMNPSKASIHNGIFNFQDQTPHEMQLSYKLSADSLDSLRLTRIITYEFASIDSLGIHCTECMISRSDDMAVVSFSDQSRPDQTTFFNITTIFKKDVGIIFYHTSAHPNQFFYRLNIDNPPVD